MTRILTCSLGAFLACMLVCVPSQAAPTVVYDSINNVGALSWGYGSFSIFNSNNGSVALGTYSGASPAFEFVPTGIPAGSVLSGFNVAIGNGPLNGIYNFDLTLFTSGNTQQLNPTLWTKLGTWSGQTDGSGNSSSKTPVAVSAGPLNLTNGMHYYLMATVPAGQGLTDGNYELAWAYQSMFSGPAWEPLLGGYATQPLSSSYPVTGAFQVLVSPQTANVPEPAVLEQLALGLSAMMFTVLRGKIRPRSAN